MIFAKSWWVASAINILKLCSILNVCALEMKNRLHCWDGDQLSDQPSLGMGIVPLSKGTLWEDCINVAPKREQGGRKKLSTRAQQKTHAYWRRAISR